MQLALEGAVVDPAGQPFDQRRIDARETRDAGKDARDRRGVAFALVYF